MHYLVFSRISSVNAIFRSFVSHSAVLTVRVGSITCSFDRSRILLLITNQPGSWQRFPDNIFINLVNISKKMCHLGIFVLFSIVIIIQVVCNMTLKPTQGENVIFPSLSNNRLVDEIVSHFVINHTAKTIKVFMYNTNVYALTLRCLYFGVLTVLMHKHQFFAIISNYES